MLPDYHLAMPAKGRGGLQIGEDLDFQRRDWIVQRAGWALMALAIFAAVAGLFGSGPLSRAQLAPADGLLWIEYERFARSRAPSALRVHFARDAVRNGQVRFWIDRAYLEEMKPERILPEPQKVEVSGERLVYEFSVGSGGGPGTISFALKPEGVGVIHGRVGLEGRDGLSFRQFLYP
jgi:hypothetical protein